MMNRLFRAAAALGLRPIRLLAVAALATASLAAPAHGKLSVINSPHNLSASGGRGTSSGKPGVVFTEEQQICVFCHVPHHAKSGTPLWSRELPPVSTGYDPYNKSKTMNATPGQPTGSSRLCLSCHDGTIALSKYVGSGIVGNTLMPFDDEREFNANLSKDLQDDHPISFAYTDALAVKSGLVSPGLLPGAVMLEEGYNLECTACHDPHDNQYGKFLVLNNGDPSKPNHELGAPLCEACHIPAGWDTSTHNKPKSATKLSKGCMECHMVHNAPGAIRLLKYAKMEGNCLGSCHNDSAAASSKNMAPLFAQAMHRHPVEYHNENPDLDHDASEQLPAVNYHVQCVDCHNAHQVNADGAPLSNPPLINGRLKGVRIGTLGGYAVTEFDVCFKCHAGGAAAQFYGVTEIMPNRMIPEPNQERRFTAENPSFHPVTADRRTNGESLITELQPTMRRIYCTDCHNSDQSAKAQGGVGGPNGPHGSAYPHILIARYDMPFFGEAREPYNISLYSLCFRCHSSSYVMTSGSAFKTGATNWHVLHVRDRDIPCFACHDPHGTSKDRGATPLNNAHLINFDKSYASGALVATPQYLTVEGVPGGSCTVNCHTATADHTHEYGSGLGRRLLNLQRPAPVKLPGRRR
jgi:nitrate reductase cytochrome c-type subunit